MLELDWRIIAPVVSALVAVTILGLHLKDRRAKARAVANHGRAVGYLRKMLTSETRMQWPAFEYGAMCDRQLRDRVDMYLGKPHPVSGVFQPYQLSPDQIMHPECRKTVDDVVAVVEKFIRDNPEAARHLKLKD